jgi:serine/threonine-protein kinase RsbW
VQPIVATNDAPSAEHRLQAPGAAYVCREVDVHESEAILPLLEDMTGAMEELGYPVRDRAAMWTALDEAITNGLRHGNQSDPSKRVRVRYRVGTQEVLAEVEDEGPGFDPSAVPDPTLPENLDRPSGRGLFLMRHAMTAVRFGGRCNHVFLYKRRTP